MGERVVAVVRHRESVLACGATETNDEPRLPTASVDEGSPTATLESLLGDLGFQEYHVERRAATGTGTTFLVSAEGRAAVADDACPEPTWELPAAFLDVGDGATWVAYRAVAPTVETVAGDAERGSTAIASDALWVLRDAATDATASGDGLEPVASVAAALVEARPSMAALANRVNRAMDGADAPAAVERAATDGLVRANEADADAAALAVETLAGLAGGSAADARVLTLSRSGTVRAALLEARPTVEVLASRPGGEGLAVADELAAAGLSVTAHPDAAVYERLRSGDVDAVLVGADAVTPDGGVVNKVGTRAAALAAELADVPCFAVCGSDKVRPAPDGGAFEPPLEPAFDRTPPALVTAVLTERGRLSSADVRAVAAEHQELAGWREG